MPENTRIVIVYVRTQSPGRPRFDDEVEGTAVIDYSYYGWLPLELSERGKNEVRHVIAVGDPWLTTPPGSEERPEPGPTPMKPFLVTAAECQAEIDERARLGLRYFSEETPDEQGEPYDRNRIMENIVEKTHALLEKVHNDEAAYTALRGVSSPVDHVEISMDGLKRIRRGTGETDRGAVNIVCHEVIRDFVASHHEELVAQAHDRRSKSRDELRAVMQAGQRLNAFS